MGLKAQNLTINLGTMEALETILGEEKMTQLLETQLVTITFKQRRLVFEKIFGYTEEEAKALDVETMEYELAFFFSRYLAQSEKAQHALLATMLSTLKLPAPPSSSATPSGATTSSPETNPSNA